MSLQNDKGIAFLTALMLLLMLTVLGVGAITITGFENRIAGMVRVTESAAPAETQEDEARTGHAPRGRHKRF